MAFLTGVDLEGRLQDHDQLALPAPPRRRKPRAKRNEDELLAIEAKPADYSELLREATKLEFDDSLEELRRMIKRTRSTMDSQMKVLDGFISDVNHLKGMQRNFDGGSPRQALPPNPEAAEPRKALKASHSCAALTSGSESRMVPKRSSGLPALGHSASAPSMATAGMLSLRTAAPLELPPRRAPPGPGSMKVPRRSLSPAGLHKEFR
mmetsp:Transcript_58545/g.130802  ORF Transcript_58545/g.130802 Transcript_58545/m.130802 type:complete len:208 (+) Transcript_58545:62-685(+)